MPVTGITSYFDTVAFSPNGRYIAGGDFCSLWIWDSRRQKLVAKWSERVWCVEFMPDGKGWNIKELLNGSKYVEHFKGGKFCHAFLNTTDYHRQHAPVSGTVREAHVIRGAAYLEVAVDTTGTDSKGQPRNRLLMRRGLEKHGYKHALSRGSTDAAKELGAPDRPGYQFLQARGMVVIETEDVGWVAVLPIGMAQVSSVVLSEKVKEAAASGGKILKGEEISHFEFGGSDIVM